MRWRSRLRVDPVIPQTSQADIAFLLLVFLLASAIFDLERGISLVLPQPGSAVVLADPEQTLVLHADAAGVVQTGTTLVPMEDVRGLVESRMRKRPDLYLILETDPDAAYQVLIDLLDQVKLARAERISLRLPGTGREEKSDAPGGETGSLAPSTIGRPPPAGVQGANAGAGEGGGRA